MTRVSEVCQAFYGFKVSTFSIFNFSGESINHLNIGEATFSFANHQTIIGDGGCPATQDFYDTTGAETIYFTLLLRRRKAPRADLLLQFWRLELPDQGASLVGFWWRPSSRLLTGNFLYPHLVEVGQVKSLCLFKKIKSRNWKQVSGAGIWWAMERVIEDGVTEVVKASSPIMVYNPIGSLNSIWMHRKSLNFHKQRNDLILFTF